MKNRELPTKFQQRKHNANGRYFLDQFDMREARWLESVGYAVAKRNGTEIGGFRHFACGCGCGVCPIAIEKSSVESLPKQPKSQRKSRRYKEILEPCIHFNGVVVP